LHFDLLKKIWFLSLLLFLINCSVKEKSEIKISFEPVLSIGVEEGNENYMLGGVADVEEDKEGNIYVLDFKFRTIRKYDKHGKFIKNIGRKGGGPGEISQFPVDMALGNGKIYLLLINTIIIYDKEGNYLNSFKLKIFPKFILVDSHGRIILVETDRKTLKLFHVFNQEGKYLTSFCKSFPAPNLKFKEILDKWLPPSVFLSTDGRLFVAHPFQYEIQIYKDRHLEKIIKRKSENYEKPHLVRVKGRGGYKVGGIQEIFEAGNYLIVLLSGEKKGKFIEVFDKRDFTYQGSLKFDIAGYPEPTRNSTIYFWNEFKLTKYRIIIL
jgi:hypothetical protein